MSPRRRDLAAMGAAKSLLLLALASAVAAGTAYAIYHGWHPPSSSDDCLRVETTERQEGGVWIHRVTHVSGGPYILNSTWYYLEPSTDDPGDPSSQPPPATLEDASRASPGSRVTYRDTAGSPTRLDPGDEIVVNATRFLSLYLRGPQGQLLGGSLRCE